MEAWCYRGVLEEKKNRIVEVIISSVRPQELMLGKIIGIGLLGIVQIAIWAILFFVGAQIAQAFFQSEAIGGTSFLSQARPSSPYCRYRLRKDSDILHPLLRGWLPLLCIHPRGSEFASKLR